MDDVMSTRSFIGKINKDDSITAIYCHFDGYPAHVGKILIDSYITEKQVDSLLAGGDMSTLDHTLNECVFYKDRGETGVDADTYSSFELFMRAGRDSWAEYFYLFNHDFWGCWDADGERVDLSQVIMREE